jgi:ribosomal protein L40E
MLWICNECTANYSVGAEKCPQCGADDHRDQGEEAKPKPAKKAAAAPQQGGPADG